MKNILIKFSQLLCIVVISILLKGCGFQWEGNSACSITEAQKAGREDALSRRPLNQQYASICTEHQNKLQSAYMRSYIEQENIYFDKHN